MDKNQKLKRYCDAMAKRVEATPEERKQLPNAKELCKQLELSHTIADLAWYGDERNPAGVLPGSVSLPEDTDAAGAIVVELRTGVYQGKVNRDPSLDGTRKQSWGMIAVICGISEHRVSNLFSVAANLSREGLRKGAGGAFLQKDPRFYAGTMKGIGVEDVAPKKLTDTQRNELRAEAIKPDSKVTSVLPAKVNALRGKAKRRAQKATTAKKANA